jgi:hypothetical protein
LTDVTEILIASIITAMSLLVALMMEAELPIYMRLHGTTSQKAFIFMLAGVTTCNLLLPCSFLPHAIHENFKPK